MVFRPILYIITLVLFLHLLQPAHVFADSPCMDKQIIGQECWVHVEELGLEEHPRVKLVRSGFGYEQMRNRYDVLMRLRGKDIQTDVSHIDRSHMRFPMIIGRRDIKGFLVDPESRQKALKQQKKKKIKKKVK